MKAAIILLISLFGVAHSIKCFQCNSLVDDACSDEFSLVSPGLRELFYIECPPKPDEEGEPFCRKTKMWFEITDEVRVHRDCGYKKREGYECYQGRADDHVVDVCQCEHDACNAATSVTVSATTVMGLVVALAAARN